MFEKRLKVVIDTCLLMSNEIRLNVGVLADISTLVTSNLSQNGQRASETTIRNACRNAISLILKKKRKIDGSVAVYLPMNAIESITDGSIPLPLVTGHSVSSRCDDSRIAESSNISNSSSDQVSTIEFSFAISNDSLIMKTNFEYIVDYFQHSLSTRSKPMNLSKLVDTVCKHVFLDLKSSISIRSLKNDFSLQISHFVQHARRKAVGKSVIAVLRKKEHFEFTLKTFSSLNTIESVADFSCFRNVELNSPILLIREQMYIDVLHFDPCSNGVHVTFNMTWIEKALVSLDSSGTIDVDELVKVVNLCATKRKIEFNLFNLEEKLKTEILCHRIENECQPQYLSIFLHFDNENITISHHSKRLQRNPSETYSDVDMDAIIRRTYETRGVKRSYEEDSFSIDSNLSIENQFANKFLEKRDLLHLKDTYNLTDAALRAIFQYVETRKKIFSLTEIERIRKEINSHYPILSSKTSARVKFEYAVRMAIFVARKHCFNLERFDTLHIRFNMDGTLIGNKHIVAISINCIEGGQQCQAAKNLVPLGLFEVQKENTEILRNSLSAEFINDIKSVKRISIKNKEIDLRIQLGGDLMNAVYVFGLAGFSSNYPCIFCTQHKDDLFVTEETAYDKTITIGKGRNKKTESVRVDATSYRDIGKRARSLNEQRLCLASGKTELGYKCEPLFGDLFDYQDYCIDTLHMKLRVFDVILKDILSHASRTGKYGAEHVMLIEKKIEALNAHCLKTVGKRFFFQIDCDEKNKTITSHGKLSGHLQDLFFVDSFPYEKILDDEIAKSARCVVDKFKAIVSELKNDRVNRRGTLKKLCLEFVREFRQSGLRTTVTPYIHTIGNHLFEFDEFKNLSDFNMQGVEKNNDMLSRLYFSSTNLSKNPLLTMMQKLYRMLEMNFENEDERRMMSNFAHTGVYEFDEEDDDQSSNHSDAHVPSRVSDEEKENDTYQPMSPIDNESNEVFEESNSNESFVWAPEKMIASTPRTENRFKSFRCKN